MYREKTAGQSFIRSRNSAIVLNYLRMHSPLSRANLSTAVRLNRSTISNIVEELIESSFIRETEFQCGMIGRPGLLLEINPQGGAVIGIEIGYDLISILLRNLVAQDLWRQNVKIDHTKGKDETIRSAEDLIQKAVDIAVERGLRPLGIGLAICGMTDIDEEKLVCSPGLKWEDIPFRKMWTEKFGIPVFVENDANAAALGEHYFAGADRSENFIYLNIGKGITGGIVINGDLYRGSAGFSGGIGRMIINGNPSDGGAHECMEDLVSQSGVMRNLRDRLRCGEKSNIFPCFKDYESLTFDFFVSAAWAGDRVCIAVFRETATWLGYGISNLVNIFNPDQIILGGPFSSANTIVIPYIKEIVDKCTIEQPGKILKIMSARYGSDTCVVGATALVLDDIFSDPMASVLSKRQCA